MRFDDQAEYAERFEWGEGGVHRLAPISDVVIVVDVLSFSTAVDIAVGRGATVYPYRWRDATVRAYADEVGAILAAPGRIPAPDGPYSLSPASLTTIPAGSRLVLPSPNGARLTLDAAGHGATVLAGCLRNASAVAAAARSLGQTVAVIAAGERWVEAGSATSSLRPAAEDLVGAGALLHALDPVRPSPEAAIALAAFRAAKPALRRFVAECSSGRELHEHSFTSDVELASALNASQAVPILDHGRYTALQNRQT